MTHEMVQTILNTPTPIVHLTGLLFISLLVFIFTMFDLNNLDGSMGLLIKSNIVKITKVRYSIVDILELFKEKNPCSILSLSSSV